ncbi:hypothetical protein Prum_006010 [Phytohabitans rumicis]|uniref:Uncharacterized protein n=1 Tax=Phytohabitans rumicis TaxID=1076125 RepID=A0A6V8KXC6_9ACTN|nr:hypothetical protein Prum_006010 [Phytohabitans rumicis]
MSRTLGAFGCVGADDRSHPHTRPRCDEPNEEFQRVNTTVEMLRAGMLTVTCPPFTVAGWLAELALSEVR